VLTGPGHSAIVRTPVPASAAAIESVNAATQAFVGP
jgi:hypothetical protein